MQRYYKCNKCKEKFSRKWNALRHKDIVHHGFAEIFNNEKENISQTKSYRKENSPSDILGFSEVQDDELLEFYGKLIKPIELLEQLSDTFPEKERNKFIAEMIIKSMTTPNPIKTLYDAISHYKADRGKMKILNYITKYKNLTPSQAEVYLSSQIFANKNKKEI